jgi:hypothetical protein
VAAIDATNEGFVVTARHWEPQVQPFLLLLLSLLLLLLMLVLYFLLVLLLLLLLQVADPVAFNAALLLLFLFCRLAVELPVTGVSPLVATAVLVVRHITAKAI